MTSNEPSTPRLLVLGGQDSGKTTYRAQAFKRIELAPGALKLASSVKDLTFMEKDVEALAKGLAPVHTPRGTFQTTTLDISNAAGRTFRLELADYDGEQVGKMSRPNAMSPAWVERAKKADHWMYFLRIDPVRRAKSFITTRVGSALPSGSAPATTPATEEHSPEIDAVEILQKLLFVRGTTLRHRVAKPKLAVLLSCWDELDLRTQEPRPIDILQERAPLFSQFVTSNWAEGSLGIWGLSSMGKKFVDNVPDRDFARTGPENSGYAVGSDGKHLQDLTLPLSWLMEPL